jgi:DNA-binding LytR/AlgR family response regulator
MAGELSADDREALLQWVAMNEAVLLDFWNGRIDGIGLARRLRPLPARR